MTIWLVRNGCLITKATNAHSEYVTLTAFPPEQWLQEGAYMLRCAYIAGLVLLNCRELYCSHHLLISHK